MACFCLEAQKEIESLNFLDVGNIRLSFPCHVGYLPCLVGSVDYAEHSLVFLEELSSSSLSSSIF